MEKTEKIYEDKICKFCSKFEKCSKDKFVSRISNITNIETKLCNEYEYKKSNLL